MPTHHHLVAAVSRIHRHAAVAQEIASRELMQRETGLTAAHPQDHHVQRAAATVLLALITADRIQHSIVRVHLQAAAASEAVDHLHVATLHHAVVVEQAAQAAQEEAADSQMT